MANNGNVTQYQEKAHTWPRCLVHTFNKEKALKILDNIVIHSISKGGQSIRRELLYLVSVSVSVV